MNLERPDEENELPNNLNDSYPPENVLARNKIKEREDRLEKDAEEEEEEEEEIPDYEKDPKDDF